MISLSRIFPRKLAIQVPLIGIVLLLLAMLAYTWLAMSQQSSFVDRELQKRFEWLAQNVASASAVNVLTRDYAALENLLSQEKGYADLISIRITDTSGLLIADVRWSAEGKMVPSYDLTRVTVPSYPAKGIIRNAETNTIWQPIVASQLVGWVRLEYSLSSIAAQKVRTWTESVATSLLILATFAYLLYLLFRRFVVAITNTVDFAKGLDGNAIRIMPVDTVATEIEELGKALNDASERLYTANKDLRDQKLALDESSIVSISDPNGIMVYVNDRFCDISGYAREDLLGLNHYFLSWDYYPEEFFDEIHHTLCTGSVWRGELKSRHINGDEFWVSATIVPFLDYSGKPYQFVSVLMDVTGLRQAEMQMKKLSGALEQTADSVFIADTRGIVEYVNPAFESITGYPREEALGRNVNLVKSGKHDKKFYQKMWAVLIRGDIYRDVLINRKKNGDLYYEEKTITPIRDEQGKITHYVSTGKDITERVEAQERLYHMAHHDVLTQLPNRVLFLDRLGQALKRTVRHKRIVAVLFLDIDRFKIVNDTLGHDAGDELIQELARRLSDSVREGDTVARLGGDEFSILLEDLASLLDIPDVINKITDVLTKPIVIQSREFFVTASMGISVAPRDGLEANDLLKFADIAMYRAKDEGRNTYMFYSREMEERSFDRLDLETRLRYALEREQFVLHYQPQIDIASGRIIGVEALVRWIHPELGMVSPATFIPLLEDTGMIVEVGKWILFTACTQGRYWQDLGPDPVRVSVNISARQFYDSAFIQVLDDVLAITDLPPQALELEITESVIMHKSETVMETLAAVNDRGIRLAIDDFGTGYSSLSYLKRFPIDTLKIDQSFVRDITTDTDDAEIVVAIVAMAKSLRLDVVAEGVETEGQLSFLKLRKCDVVQGYLFSKPVPATEIAPMILKDRGRAGLSDRIGTTR